MKCAGMFLHHCAPKNYIKQLEQAEEKHQQMSPNHVKTLFGSLVVKHETAESMEVKLKHELVGH